MPMSVKAKRLIKKIVSWSGLFFFGLAAYMLYHQLSKYDFALRLAEKYGLDKNLVVPISMDNDTKIWTEKRPKKILLDNHLVKHILKLKELKIKI